MSEQNDGSGTPPAGTGGLDDIVIRLEDDGLSETIEGLSKNNADLRRELDELRAQLQQQTEQSQKEKLLSQLEAMGKDLKEFENLSIAALEGAVKALGGQTAIQVKEKEGEPERPASTVEVWDPARGKHVDFWKKMHGTLDD